MLKDATYKEKFKMLQNWLPFVLDSIKKDIRQDHLKKDLAFVKKYLANTNYQKASAEELAKAYSTAINEEENSEDIGDFITNRWLMKHTEIYDFFEQQLRQINPEFTEMTEINEDISTKIVNGSTTQFGAPKTYIFSVLNSVVFPKSVYDKLQELASSEQKNRQEEEQKLEETKSLEKIKLHYEQQMTRLKEKYEKKIQGMQKLYDRDVEMLKKQNAQLQRKLQSHA